MEVLKEKIFLKKGGDLRDVQMVNRRIYGAVDDRFFSNWELFSNQERFMMRALKGIRKDDMEKLRVNLVIATSWFLALMNRIHVDIEDAVWNRFPYLCSYCGSCPCACKKIKPSKRARITKKPHLRPKNIRGFQEMFEEIYPSGSRTLEHAGIHQAEEQGELSEAMQVFAGSHKKSTFQEIIDESADYLSCVFAIANSANIDLQSELEKFYSNNCHACHQAPCKCDFRMISDFKS
ncbi:hypothetical protein C4544_01190 [candidate division WS5 bacterium]|uniref:NTP pyrophosphohydrolase MazG putative catalytic core domain-containing protein n=1 Tax=candidate division WS5 bacterium TaxID=2093353 RepID=A0A419DG93_9BACT|nr:MAG: hypothetical protein C4544_01190 [candidate division WS5 bacterium]